MTGRRRSREVHIKRRSTGEPLGVYVIPERDGNGVTIDMEEAAQAVTKRVSQVRAIPMNDMFTTFTLEV